MSTRREVGKSQHGASRVTGTSAPSERVRYCLNFSSRGSEIRPELNPRSQFVGTNTPSNPGGLETHADSVRRS